jgi:quercetin dioxygenase-like cupin family protein
LLTRSPFLTALALGFGLTAPAAHALDSSASEKTVAVKEIVNSAFNDAGQPIRLPGGSLRLVVSTYDIPPGAKLPWHKHPYQRYAYVAEGDLTVDQAGRGPRVYHAGEFVAESVNLWHFGENAGTATVRLLVIDQLPPGKAATILKPHAP